MPERKHPPSGFKLKSALQNCPLKCRVSFFWMYAPRIYSAQCPELMQVSAPLFTLLKELICTKKESQLNLKW